MLHKEQLFLFMFIDSVFDKQVLFPYLELDKNFNYERY